MGTNTNPDVDTAKKEATTTLSLTKIGTAVTTRKSMSMRSRLGC